LISKEKGKEWHTQTTRGKCLMTIGNRKIKRIVKRKIRLKKKERQREKGR
jgi:hypothetical protein